MKPFTFQKKDVGRMTTEFGGRVLLAYDMGLGKTPVSLWWLWRNQIQGTRIIVCPNSVKYHWERTARNLLGWDTWICEGRKPPPHRAIGKGDHLFVINYEIFQYWIKWFHKLKPQALIIDECQRIKNKDAKCTKAVKALAQGGPKKNRPIPSILALSGTPLENRPIELFPVLNILMPQEFSSYTRFGTTYSRIERFRGRIVFKEAKNLPELNKVLRATVMIRRQKKDVLKDLPTKTRHVVPVDISSKREYDDAKEDLIGWLKKNGKAGAAKRASKAVQLAQIGYLKRLAASLKLKSVYGWVDEFLSATDEKLLLFGIHRAILEPLRERYRSMSCLVTGSTKKRKRQGQLDRFVEDKSKRILIGQIHACGTGVDGLQHACSKGAFVELDWKPNTHNQAEDRLLRIGQLQSIDWYYLLAKGTIEEPLAEVLQKKQLILDKVLDGGKVADSLDVFTQLKKELLTFK